MPTRRQLLTGAAVAAGAAALPAGAAALPASAAQAAPADLFPLGVASGDPLPRAV
ncbi:MAG: twin-arginine translocation signal domain-containing protein, partial [Actinoplanes sp.]